MKIKTKNKIGTKFMSIILAAIMCFPILPLTVFAEGIIIEQGQIGDYNSASAGFGYTLDSDGVFTLVGSGAMPDFEVKVGRNTYYRGIYLYPDDGSDKELLNTKAGVTALSISSGITTIGKYAFASCSNFINTLVIPDTVTSIADNAFTKCGFNGGLVIPEGVAEIGASAFANCSGFNGNLHIPDSVTSIGSSAFASCSGFDGTLELSSNITSVPDSCFLNCTGFTGSLVIPEGVAEIGASAFANCSGFNGTLTLPSTLTSIKLRAFGNCTGFTGDLYIPDDVSMLTPDVFRLFGNLNGGGSLHLPANLTKIYYDAFYGSGFNGSLVIPEGVTEIGASAFYSTDFTSLSLPSTLTKIDDRAFQCWKLSGTLEIPDSVTSLHGCAFHGAATGDDILEFFADHPELIVVDESNSDYTIIKCSGCSNVVKKIYNSESASVSLNVGDTVALSQEIIPTSVPKTNGLRFIAIDDSVASVTDDGQVTGLSVGDTEVIATSVSDKRSSFKYNIRVTAPHAISETVVGAVGSTVDLGGGTDFTYSSSDATVATVDENGIVTCHAGGVATITVTDPISGLPRDLEFVSLDSSASAVPVAAGSEFTVNVFYNSRYPAGLIDELGIARTITYTSSDTNFIRIDTDSEGVQHLVAVAPTNGNVPVNITYTYTYGDQTLTQESNMYLSVSRPNAASVVIDTPASEGTIPQNGTLQLAYHTEPEYSEPTSVEFVSSDPSVASVDENGLITAHGTGNATITVKVNGDDALSATYDIEVVPGGPASIIVTNADSLAHLPVATGGMYQIEVSGIPTGADMTGITYTSSDENVLIVDENGVITPRNGGSAIVTVSMPNGVATSFPVMVHEITTSENHPEIIGKGSTYQIVASSSDPDATLTYSLTHPEDASIATVDPVTGLVTAHSEGCVDITVSDGVGSTSLDVTIIIPDATGISVDNADALDGLTDENIGDKIDLVVTVSPAGADDESIVYTSSDESVASVDENGEVTIVGPGEAVITVTHPDGPETTINVKVYQVTVSEDHIVIAVGGTDTIEAQSSVSGSTITYAGSNDSVATVDSNGVVTGVNAGTAVITVSDGTDSKEIKVVVVELEIENSDSLTREDDIVLTIEPDETVSIKNETTTYLSDNPDVIAIVDGMPVIVGPGDAVIAVTTTVVMDDAEKTITAMIPVHVDSIPVTDITIDNAVSFSEMPAGGEPVRINVSKEPDFSDNESYTYESSDPTVAAVDADGNVTPIGPGTAVITITSQPDGTTETLTVTVYDINVPATVILVVGKVTPSGVTGGSKPVVLTSSDAETVKVSGEKLIGMNVGLATITASDGTITKTFDAKAVSVNINASEPHTVTAEPSGDVTIVSVTYESSDPSIATVDDDGKITDVGNGKVIITVTVIIEVDGQQIEIIETFDHTAKIPVENISVSDDNIMLDVDEAPTAKIDVTVEPANAGDKRVTFVSSDPSVAKIDANGNVIAVGRGAATITVVSRDDPSKTATVNVTVTRNYISIDVLTTVYIEEGGADIKVYVDSDQDYTVTYESSDESVITVDEKGHIKAVSEGEADITVTVTLADGTVKTRTVHVRSMHDGSFRCKRCDWYDGVKDTPGLIGFIYWIVHYITHMVQLINHLS